MAAAAVAVPIAAALVVAGGRMVSEDFLGLKRLMERILGFPHRETAVGIVPSEPSNVPYAHSQPRGNYDVATMPASVVHEAFLLPATHRGCTR